MSSTNRILNPAYRSENMEKFGISTALLTPFDANGHVDQDRLAAHAQGLMSRGTSGVTLFGTTGEGASMGPTDRAAGLSALANDAVPPEQITLGICACSQEEALIQIRQGMEFGVRTFLLPPPYYFGGVSDDGLLKWFTDVIEAAPSEARFILYHIPQVIGVALTPSVTAKLWANFPDRIRAIKDSSGNWDNADQLFEIDGLPVLIGDERLLHKAAARGSTGAISGMANLMPDRLQQIIDTQEEDPDLSALVIRVVSVPVIPALKRMLARQYDDPGWENLRAPFMPLSDSQSASLRTEEFA